MNRSPKSDQYLRMSEEDLRAAGLTHHKTDSNDELQTRYGLEHHSVRPAEVPEGTELSEAEQAALQERLDLREKNDQERAADIKAGNGQENEGGGESREAVIWSHGYRWEQQQGSRRDQGAVARLRVGMASWNGMLALGLIGPPKGMRSVR